MLSIDDNLRYIYKNDRIPYASETSEKKLTIFFPDLDLTIEYDQLSDENFSLTESLCSDTDLLFGSCESAVVKFLVADVEEDITGQVFSIVQTVNDTYTMPLGTYKVESAKKQNDKRFKEVVAYDLLKSKLDVDVADWYNSFFTTNQSATLLQFRTAFFAYVGLTIVTQTLPNDSMTVEKTIEPVKLSGRDVAQAIGEINGMFGHMTRDNKFKYVGLSGLGLYPSETLYPSEDLFPSEPGEILGSVGYKSLQYEEYYVHQIDKLQIRTEDGDVGTTAGTGTNAYVIEGNFLLYGKNSSDLDTVATNVFNVIKNKYYRPHTSVIPGLPYLEVGDAISIITTTDVIESFVFSRTLTGIQALTDTLSATGNEYRGENFNLKTEFKQLQSRTAKIRKDVDQVSVTLADTAEELETEIAVMQGEINLKVSANGVINAINASSEGITISGTKLDLMSEAINIKGTLYIELNNAETSVYGVNGSSEVKIISYEEYDGTPYGGTLQNYLVLGGSGSDGVIMEGNRAIVRGSYGATLYGANYARIGTANGGSTYHAIEAGHNSNGYVFYPPASDYALGESSHPFTKTYTEELYVKDQGGYYFRKFELNSIKYNDDYKITLNSSREFCPNVNSTSYPFSLGSQSYPFASLYVKKAYFQSGSDWTEIDPTSLSSASYSYKVTLTGGSNGCNLVPSGNGTYHLGSSSRAFANCYLTNIYHQDGTLGFFGKSPVSKKTINKLQSSADLATVISRFNLLVDTLGGSGYGLITASS